EWSSIGSCNLDYRSLHINFELNALVRSKQLNQQVADMLIADFADSTPTVISNHWWPQFLTKCARLASPLL
ncbi:MAG TPA: phospholipase D-like domain-containing protein, partial [Pseudomonadales bacterium]|nr:phospholipase D-like domain-containing protein [Pseudomonadales bacterium]